MFLLIHVYIHFFVNRKLCIELSGDAAEVAELRDTGAGDAFRENIETGLVRL